MRRIDRERRQHREHVAHEIGFEPAAVLPGEGAAVHQLDPGPAQLRHEAPPARLLAVHQAPRAAVDGLELLRRRQPVGARRAHAGGLLSLQAGHTHHVELVEVLRGDRQEAQSLQKRMGRVRRLFQHPLVEGQPGHLAVDEPRRRVQAGPVECASVYRHGGMRLPCDPARRTGRASLVSGSAETCRVYTPTRARKRPATCAPPCTSASVAFARAVG